MKVSTKLPAEKLLEIFDKQLRKYLQRDLKAFKEIKEIRSAA